VTLARPDLLERRPTWGSGSNVISLSLGPLNDGQMADLVTGTVSGIPEQAVDVIVERAAGVPLYAVELLRGLLAAEDLEAGDDGYRIIGDLSETTVPESLRAVIGARLDRFDPDDRDLIQDAAVLGQSFTLAALSALTDLEIGELETRMAPISKREVIAAIRDPRSPERGQYQFVQSLIREVALSRMSKDLRRERHLAVAKHMETLNEPELAPVVASHYLYALEATPAGEEREGLRKRAIGSMKTAVERAVNVRGHEQVISISKRALEMAGSDEERAPFWEHITAAATAQAEPREAEHHAGLAIDHYRRTGDRHSEWRATRLLGFAYAENYDWRKVVELLDPIVREVDDLTLDSELARMVALQARALSLIFMGTGEGASHALELSEAALQAVETLKLVPEIAEALITRATILGLEGRHTESKILFEGAIELADQHDLYQSQTRARNNYLLGKNLLDVEEKIALEEEARQIGIKAGHRTFNVLATELIANLRTEQGDFDEARKEMAGLGGSESAYPGFQYLGRAFIHAWEGDEDKLRSTVESWRELSGTRPSAVDMISVDDLEAIEHVFLGSAFDVEPWTHQALQMEVSVTLADLETLVLAGLGSGDREALDYFIESTARWSPQLDVLHDYLVGLATVADGDVTPLESLESRLDDFIGVPLLPLSLALMLVTAQYLPAAEPKRQEFLDRAREIATDRGWHGFIALMDRTT
jgi:tetratricopeptide (TPR) repeat protein